MINTQTTSLSFAGDNYNMWGSGQATVASFVFDQFQWTTYSSGVYTAELPLAPDPSIHESRPEGVTPLSRFAVEGVIVGDARTWDEVRFDHVADGADTEALLDLTGAEEGFAMVVAPTVPYDRLAESVHTAAEATAQAIADEDAEWCRQIGRHGLEIVRRIADTKPAGEAVNILTHCNAGWLAFVDHGSATSPIYAAREAGIPVHVWVDETRPRNQGARLTAWELGQQGIPHTVIADNTGGHLMQRGRVDLVITGTDRTSRAGDVANKIGTYLKALAARDNGVPFHVALPSSTFDWSIADGVRDIPIEERDGSEVATISGWESGGEREVRLIPEGSRASNFAFDVTPARLVTGLITERGICEASEEGIRGLFPEKFALVTG